MRMLKMLNAYTREIDDPDAAVAELLRQLDLKNGLLKNSVGIVACHYEFIETGVTSALCRQLPFDVVGCSVIGNSVNGQYGLEQLSLTVLTSDDVEFATALSDVITQDNDAAPVQDAYRQARAKLTGDPSLILVLGPLMTDLSGEAVMAQVNAAAGGRIPIFGTMSNDTYMTRENGRTFLNQDLHRFKAALVLMHGKINPRFFTTAISDKNIQNQTAIVTESEGYMIKKVNNMPVVEYLESIGLHTQGLKTTATLPFLVDYGDGTPPAALVMYTFMPEGVYCGGKIPVGSSIAFAEVDEGSVLETAEITVQHALDEARANGASCILAIPCLSRCLLLSPLMEREMEKTAAMIGNEFPFMLLYSGGEICPIYNQKHEFINRFHNLTYTLVVL
jgi:hypothetical protein